MRSPRRAAARRVLQGYARFTRAGGPHQQIARAAVQAAAQRLVELGHAARHGLAIEGRVVLRRHEARKHVEPAGANRIIVIAATKAAAAQLDHAQPPPLGPVQGA